MYWFSCVAIFALASGAFSKTDILSGNINGVGDWQIGSTDGHTAEGSIEPYQFENEQVATDTLLHTLSEVMADITAATREDAQVGAQFSGFTAFSSIKARMKKLKELANNHLKMLELCHSLLLQPVFGVPMSYSMSHDIPFWRFISRRRANQLGRVTNNLRSTVSDYQLRHNTFQYKVNTMVSKLVNMWSLTGRQFGNILDLSRSFGFIAYELYLDAESIRQSIYQFIVLRNSLRNARVKFYAIENTEYLPQYVSDQFFKNHFSRRRNSQDSKEIARLYAMQGWKKVDRRQYTDIE
ncbi:hypothetical protein MP228_003968 [Amoeboaphelidium protococcarum]|nr:hypothetical protein MP228_003968 [Amoeboaphelidium protococcarum]